MIDIVLLLIMSVSALFGLIKGFVGTLVSTAAWLLAGWAAFQFGDDVGDWLAEGGVPTPTEVFGGYALSFIVVMVVVLMIGMLSRSLVQSAGLSGVDRLLGTALGLLRGGFLASLLVLLMGFTPITREPSWRQSQVLPLLSPGAGWMRSRLPQWSMPRVDFRNLPSAGDNGAVGELPVPLLEEAAAQLIGSARDNLSASGSKRPDSAAQATAGKDPAGITSTSQDPANIESTQGRDPVDIES
ncbi:MAG TPA: CvpA family protein, partial [Pseudoxanthomonas sp.]